MKTIFLFIVLILTAQSVQAKDTLLYFTASWCGPCQQMKPHFNDLEVKGLISEYKYHEVDYNDKREYAKRWKISGPPTFIIASPVEGKKTLREHTRYVGYMSLKALKKFLKTEQ